MRWKMASLLRDALRDQDERSLRSLFATRGYELGVHCHSPCAERIVLEEVLEGRSNGEMLLVFFKELGGRYSLGRESCVWRELIHADAQRLMRSSSAMDGVVRLLVDELHMPLPDEGMLQVACQEGGWKVLLTLGPRLMDHFESELNRVWAHRLMTSAEDDEEWLAKALLPRLGESVLLEWHVKRKRQRGLVAMELEHRQEAVRQKQVMLLLKKRDDAPHALTRVFNDPLLAHYILRDVTFPVSP